MLNTINSINQLKYKLFYLLQDTDVDFDRKRKVAIYTMTLQGNHHIREVCMIYALLYFLT